MSWRTTGWGAALAVGAVCWLGAARPAAGELGWKEADYVQRYGPAIRSPLTPNEAQFRIKGQGGVLVIFDGERSREEAFVIDRGNRFVPPRLLQAAQAAVHGEPKRRVQFHLHSNPTAAIYEAHAKGITLQIDYRNGAVVRVAQCRDPQPCVLIDRLLAMERRTDDLMARTEAQMHREGH